MGTMINVVATEVQPEVEGKFNKWYDEVHIPLLFKFKGMKKVTRYKLLKEAGGNPSYLAIYEFENRKAFEEYQTSAELAAGRAEMQETWQGKGFEITSRVQYEVLRTWER